MKILFLEDEPTIREVLTEYMKMQDYDVTCAEDGEHALRLLKECRFDMAVLDIMVPEAMRQNVNTSIMLSMALVITMSIMFIGYGAVYSIEVENDVPLRMRLFCFQEKSLMTAKIIAYLIFMTIAFIIYGVFQLLTMDIPKPALSSIICLMVSLYLIGVMLLVIAHSIANIFRKFSITFGITMSVYFMLMILTGMMGISTEQLPKMLQKAAVTLPMTYISNDFADFWQGGTYNFMPLIQSFIFLGAVSGILMMYAEYRNRRIIK